MRKTDNTYGLVDLTFPRRIDILTNLIILLLASKAYIKVDLKLKELNK